MGKNSEERERVEAGVEALKEFGAAVGSWLLLGAEAVRR